jgi:penicillin-binding protein 2
MFRRKKRNKTILFEESLSDEFQGDVKLAEVSIENKPFFYIGIFAVIIAILVFVKIFSYYADSKYYSSRARANATESKIVPAPRGLIYDKEGDIIAENKAVFVAMLDVGEFLKNQDLQSSTLSTIYNIFGISSSSIWSMIKSSSDQSFASPIVLNENLTQSQLVNLQAIDLPTIIVSSDFQREYPLGAPFSSVLGYVSRVSENDIKNNPDLNSNDFIGKTGIEAFYDKTLRGIPGLNVNFVDAYGKTLGQSTKTNPIIGNPLTLTIDGGLQSYFYKSMQNELAILQRNVGFGIAIDPQTGAILSLVNLPGYDNNVFENSSSSAEIKSLLMSPDKPLFNRAVNGVYNPGSTIKPLDAVAALKEGIIDPSREIFSPGYLLVPNPYDSTKPSRYLDWQYQGNVNLATAIAQSSDVYFYLVGGGSPQVTNPLLNDPSDYGIKGLGIDKLNEWWQKFGLGKATGIDMPNESVGFLPTPDWKKQKFGNSWLLGDTYNVSIGQGDLLVSPLELIDYISAIANGGKIYRPFLNASSTIQVNEDLSYLYPQIKEVQKGMAETVTFPKGTAYTMHDLPFSVCAKTGSAQVKNNQEENALFVGYAPCDNPKIAILILIENSKQGSLNAVPIAKDVLNWYYNNRLK